MIRGLVGFVNRDAQSLVGDLRTLDFLPSDVDHAAAGAALRGVFEASSAGRAARAGEDAGGGRPTFGDACLALDSHANVGQHDERRRPVHIYAELRLRQGVATVRSGYNQR